MKVASDLVATERSGARARAVIPGPVTWMSTYLRRAAAADAAAARFAAIFDTAGRPASTASGRS